MFEESTNNPFKDEAANNEETSLKENQEEAKEGSEESAEAQEKAQEGTQEKDLQAELDDLNNKYLRMAADFDNYRKRQAQEREGLLKYGAAETLTKLLTVLDTIDRANDSMADLEDCKALKTGYQVAFKQLDEVLQKCGLEKIEVEGKEFDPNLMEAVMKTPSAEHPDGHIIAELQKGYKLGDKILRPALVNVAVQGE